MISLQTSFVPADLKAAVAEARRRQVVEKGVFDAMDFENRQKAFTVAGTLNNRLISEIQTKVNSAIENGMSYRDFVKSMDPATVQAITAPQVVYDNAVNFSYQKGRFDAQQRIKSLKPFLQYITMGDDRVRPNHAILHGITAPQDSDFWAANYPPNGHRCRCIAQARSVGDVERRGLTVETSKGEIDDRLLREQVEKGTPPNKIVRPGADKGWTGSPTPGLTTLDSWTEKFKKIDPKFKVPVFTPDPVKYVPPVPSAVTIPIPPKVLKPKDIPTVDKIEKIIKKSPTGTFIPAINNTELRKRLVSYTVSGNPKTVALSGKDLNVKNAILKALETAKREGFNLKFESIKSSKMIAEAGVTRYYKIGRPVDGYKIQFNTRLTSGTYNTDHNFDAGKLQRYKDRIKRRYQHSASLEQIAKIESAPFSLVSESAYYTDNAAEGVAFHEAGHAKTAFLEKKLKLQSNTVSEDFIKRVRATGFKGYDHNKISLYAFDGNDIREELIAELEAIEHSGKEIKEQFIKDLIKIKNDTFAEYLERIKKGP